MSRRARVFLGIDQVGGHLWGLHAALERLGVDSDVMYFRNSPVEMPCTHDRRFRGSPKPVRVVRKTISAVAAALRHDILHFNNAWSFLVSQADLGWLHAAGKPVFVTFNGSNVRPPRYTLEHFRYSQFGRDGVPAAKLPATDDEYFHRIEIWERHARAIFCLNPDLCRFVDNPIFIPYLKETVLDAPPSGRSGDSSTIRIAHAPTHRAIKGTDRFLEAIERVRAGGQRIELVLIEGLPRDEALRLIGTCDLLLDQLLVGWYGGVAVEAMALGVPVMCYLREEDLAFLPPDMREELPILRTSWETVFDDLAAAVRDPAALRERGERSRRFVLQHHDPVRIAERVLREYRKVVEV